MDTFYLVLSIVLSYAETSLSINVLVLNISETDPKVSTYFILNVSIFLSFGIIWRMSFRIGKLNTTQIGATRHGTIIWNNTAETNCNWKSADPVAIKGYFRFTSNWHQLVLDKALDLEVLKYYINKPTVAISLLCPSEIQITIHICPENEFPPEFLNSPYTTSVLEGTIKGTGIYSLHDMNIDRDAFKYNTVSFSSIPYQIEKFDGRAYFSLSNETGEVTSKVDIDYEQLDCNWFILRILATDNGGLHTETTLNITFIDVDDMPPEFVSRYNCYRICTKIESYSKIIDIYKDGPLSDIQPENIYARDGDRGVNSKIKYTIHKSTSGRNNYIANDLANNLAIDEDTGVVKVISPFVHFTSGWLNILVDPFIIHITICATESPSINRSTTISFFLVVYRGLPRIDARYPTTSPNRSIFTNDSSENNSSLTLILCIIVPFSEAVLLTIIVLLIFHKKRTKVMENCERNIENDDSQPSSITVDSPPSSTETEHNLEDINNTFDREPYENYISRDTIDIQAVHIETNAAEYTDLNVTNLTDNVYTQLQA